MASDIMATLPVNAPPKNSKIENERFSKKAIKIFLSVFIISLQSTDSNFYIWEIITQNSRKINRCQEQINYKVAKNVIF